MTVNVVEGKNYELCFIELIFKFKISFEQLDIVENYSHR